MTMPQEAAGVPSAVVSSSQRPRNRRLRVRDAAVAPKEVPLKVNDLRFLNLYLSNGGNATQAYRSIHPNAKYTTAEVNGYKTLRKTAVKEELARRLRYDGGITKEWGQTRLLDYEAMAVAKGDYAAGAAIVMDAMKLAGHLVEKREVKTVTEEETQAVRALVQQSLGAN